MPPTAIGATEDLLHWYRSDADVARLASHKAGNVWLVTHDFAHGPFEDDFQRSIEQTLDAGYTLVSETRFDSLIVRRFVPL